MAFFNTASTDVFKHLRPVEQSGTLPPSTSRHGKRITSVSPACSLCLDPVASKETYLSKLSQVRPGLFNRGAFNTSGTDHI